MSAGLIKSRCINALRCYGNYALSLFGLVRITHMPTFVSVEPSSLCQLHCPECPVGISNSIPSGEVLGAGASPFMSLDVWYHVLDQIKPYAHTVQFYFQGEPLLNKNLPQMIRSAREAGLYTIVSTNAQALTPQWAEDLVRSGLNRIIVSMDGLTQESYGAYRIGGSVEKVKKALRWLRQAKSISTPSAKRSVFCQRSSLTIELQVLRLRTNEHEWQEFRKQYKALGADRLMFKTAQLYNYRDAHPLMPSDSRYSRYIQGQDGLFYRKSLHHGCLRVWSGVVISANGEVLPCCYDKNHAYTYGNIMDTPLQKLFANEKSIAFRRAAIQEQPQICQECWR